MWLYRRPFSREKTRVEHLILGLGLIEERVAWRVIGWDGFSVRDVPRACAFVGTAVLAAT